MRDWSVGELTEILERLLSDFHDDVAELYSDEDRAAGCMKGQDRHGNERDFALLRCSIGVLTLPKGLIIANPERIGSEIAGVKAAAKENESGFVVRVFGETN